jgi:hypothetical protein
MAAIKTPASIHVLVTDYEFFDTAATVGDFLLDPITIQEFAAAVEVFGPRRGGKPPKAGTQVEQVGEVFRRPYSIAMLLGIMRSLRQYLRHLRAPDFDAAFWL